MTEKMELGWLEWWWEGYVHVLVCWGKPMVSCLELKFICWNGFFFVFQSLHSWIQNSANFLMLVCISVALHLSVLISILTLSPSIQQTWKLNSLFIEKLIEMSISVKDLEWTTHATVIVIYNIFVLRKRTLASGPSPLPLPERQWWTFWLRFKKRA